MTGHTYSLRSRVSSSSLVNKTPTQSPVPKPTKSPRKRPTTTPILQLKHVTGTTTSTPSGLSCCATSDSYAYCAGSVAVLACITTENTVSYRYFKARPTVLPVNPIASYYDSSSTPTTPSRRRTILNSRKAYEDHNGGFSFSRDGSDETAGQTWSARERIKTASCVSISPDGKMLAVGETGYNPRVLLFSTLDSALTDTPLSIMTEHSIGIRSVAFSPDSKYLATLGDINDGYLYIWQINTKTGAVKLFSSNKCTTNVCDMTWTGYNVVTVGTRHIKIWQALNKTKASSVRRSNTRQEGDSFRLGPMPLQGRNCLLGTFVDATFTAVTTVSDTRAIVCADNGHICLLDLTDGKTELSSIGRTEVAVAAISYRQSPSRLVWANGSTSLEEHDIGDLKANDSLQLTTSSSADARKRRRISRQSLLRQSLGLSPPKRANIVALGCFNDKVVCIDARGLIRLSRIDTYDLEPDICTVSSHDGFVRGVQRLPKVAGLGAFFTWARNGELRFWNQTGGLLRVEMVELDEDLDASDGDTNDLKVVRYSENHQFFVVGDQFGMVKIIEDGPWKCVQSLRAHSAEVTSIDIHDPTSLMATCGRDRMVQVFRVHRSQIELLQTSDDHISAVTQVIFSQDGKRLLSCSSDRTVVVRELVERDIEEGRATAFMSMKVITMKAAPLSMAFPPSQRDYLVVSTMDRHIVKVDLLTGAVVASFKVSDRESDDTVNLSSIRISSSNSVDNGCLLVGYSATDKSVRVYDLEKGVLLGRDSGHTEGVSDVAILEDEREEDFNRRLTVVSTGLDSTIMLWSVTAANQPLLNPQQELSQAQMFDNDPEKVISKASPASLPPLRKILSKVEIAGFSRQNSPTRESSPNGLRRRTSRLALATTIDEVVEPNPHNLVRSSTVEVEPGIERRSPSPPTQLAVRPKKQRSHSEMGKGMESKSSGMGQPLSLSSSIELGSSTARHSTRANNSRLRRPPSVPSDLRTHVATKSRRQSVSSANDLGSINLATEQTCRMLRVYDKKLQTSRGGLELDDVEADLENVLRTVRQKKAKMHSGKMHEMRTTKKDIDEDIAGLSKLLEKTSVS